MVIDYKLTGRCNSSCDFCWDFCKGIKESNVADIMKAFEKLTGTIDMISLTGGEPLVVSEFDIIIRELHEMGFKIYLSTNGILMERHMEAISEYVSVLGVPIDAIDADLQSRMGRMGDTVRMNLENLVRIKNMNPAMITKVGTVATVQNYGRLAEIGYIIFSLEKPVDSWRVYQFTEYGNACHSRGKYHLDDEIYFGICKDLKRKFGSKVSFLSSADTKQSYWLITRELYLARLTDNDYLK